VLHLHAAVLQHELEIAVTDGEHQIPSDRPQDHLSGQLPTLESLILPSLCCSSPSSSYHGFNRLDRQHKDATEPDTSRACCYFPPDPEARNTRRGTGLAMSLANKLASLKPLAILPVAPEIAPLLRTPRAPGV